MRVDFPKSFSRQKCVFICKFFSSMHQNSSPTLSLRWMAQAMPLTYPFLFERKLRVPASNPPCNNGAIDLQGSLHSGRNSASFQRHVERMNVEIPAGSCNRHPAPEKPQSSEKSQASLQAILDLQIGSSRCCWQAFHSILFADLLASKASRDLHTGGLRR